MFIPEKIRVLFSTLIFFSFFRKFQKYYFKELQKNINTLSDFPLFNAHISYFNRKMNCTDTISFKKQSKEGERYALKLSV